MTPPRRTPPARRERGAPARGTQRARPPRPVDPERLLARMPWGSLWPLLRGSDAERDAVLARLRAFAGELLRWNRGVSNLVSHDDEARLVERHLAESLAGLELLNALACKHILDFGSGGGFPAIPLILAGDGERWTLVESRRNKTLFPRRAVQALGPANVTVDAQPGDRGAGGSRRRPGRRHPVARDAQARAHLGARRPGRTVRRRGVPLERERRARGARGDR